MLVVIQEQCKLIDPHIITIFFFLILLDQKAHILKYHSSQKLHACLLLIFSPRSLIPQFYFYVLVGVLEQNYMLVDESRFSELFPMPTKISCSS